MSEEFDKEYVAMGEAFADTLMHHGIRGMKWGVRRSESGRVQLGAAPRRAHAKRKEAVQKLSDQHKINKASRQRVRASENSQIDAARRRSEGADRKIHAANAQFKSDKKTVGRAEANQKRNKTLSKVDADHQIAMKTKHGKEKAGEILGVVGAVTLMAAVAAARVSKTL